MSTYNLRSIPAALVFLLLAGGSIDRVQAEDEPVAGAPTPAATTEPPTAGEDRLDPPATPQPHPHYHVFPDLFTNLGQDFKHLPSWENLAITAGGGGLSVALHQYDEEWTEDLANSPGLSDAALPGKYIGKFYVQFGAAALTYIIGRAGDHPKAERVGWDLLRGQVVAQIMTQGLKLAVRRERPDMSDHLSFPSGHASSALATAGVLHHHYGWKVGLPSYIVASYVALSRMPSNKHFISDITFGATLGIVSGRAVTFGERNPRFAIEPFLLPRGGGVQVSILPRRPSRPGT